LHYFGCVTSRLFTASSIPVTIIGMDRTTKLVAVFVCVFALPFAGFGLSTLAKALQQLLAGTANTSVWMMLIFGLVFSGIGIGLMFLAVFGVKFLKRQQRAQAEHPAEPWLWREDWAQGRIKGNTQSGMISAWVFAVLWNLISVPMLFFVPQQAARNPVAYLGFLFPVIGVGLLVRAIRLTLAYIEFGKTCFEMSPVPGVIGGELKGTIQARFPHSPDHGIQLRLSCVNRVTTGSGNSQNTTENILWRGEASLSSTQLYPGPAGTSIPVCFHIPWDALPTETRGARDSIVWMLDARADVPGVDYHDVFVVPVFRTAQTPAHAEPESVPAAPVAAQPGALTVAVTKSAAGVEFYFSAARNKGFAMVTTTFLLIFGSVTFFLAHSSAPVIFPLAFGFFALILLYICFQMWFATTRVGIGNGTLLLQEGWLGGGKIQRFAFSELGSITSKITSQQGGGTGTPYYDIELSLRSGRKVSLGHTLKNKQEVDWLIEEMRRLTGLQPKAMTVGTS
jgi:hypothetical protein